MATRLAELGVQPHVIEAVLNHVSGHKAGVAGIYNRALYAAEKRQALHLWSEHVLLSSDAKRNTPCRFAIGLVDQDLRECCHAGLFASAG